MLQKKRKSWKASINYKRVRDQLSYIQFNMWWNKSHNNIEWEYVNEAYEKFRDE